MKLICLTHLRPSLARLAILAALGLGVSSPAFGVVLNISGGGGTPLSFTLPSPVTYTVTSLEPTGAPGFVFKGAGNPFGATSVTGNITFSVNGGGAQTITGARAGVSAGDIAPNDTFFFGTLLPLAVGDTVVLSAGTLTTTGNVAGAAPASGDFQTFLDNISGFRMSTFGTAGGGNVPDAGSTAALLGLGLMGVFSFARISRRGA